MHERRCNASATVHNNLLYVVSRRDISGDITGEIYDPIRKAWTKVCLFYLIKLK